MAMEQLAADTGGKAFYNINDLNAAMMHAIEKGRTTTRWSIRRPIRRWMGVIGASKSR